MMLTRCPHCRTGFRIHPEQLRMRQGRVRCGHCSKPFNALEALLDEDGRTPVRLEDLEQREERPAPETSPPEPLAPDFHLDIGAPARTPDAESALEPEESEESEEDRDSAPLFVLEEAVPDPQQELPISAVDDEVTELYIDGFAWQRREPRVEKAAAEDQPAADGAQEAGTFDVEFQLPAAADEQDHVPAAASGGLHFTIEEVGPAGGESAATAAEGGLAEMATPARDDDFRIDFIFPSPTSAEPESAAAAQTPAEPAAVGDAAEPEAATLDEPTELGDTAAAAQQVASDLTTAADDHSRTPDRPEPTPATPLPLRAAETEDDDAAGGGTAERVADTLLPPLGADASLSGQPGDFDLDETDSRRPALWGLGIGMLAMILAAQSVILFRNSIVQIVPESQPLYRSLCARLGCDMPLPREAGYIAIGASDLQPDERRPGLYVLRTTIENRAPFQQALPHLELTLTDARDRAIARRVIAPRDWKPGSGDEAFEAGTRLEADIPFAAAELKPVGYRVYAFYP